MKLIPVRECEHDNLKSVERALATAKSLGPIKRLASISDHVERSAEYKHLAFAKVKLDRQLELMRRDFKQYNLTNLKASDVDFTLPLPINATVKSYLEQYPNDGRYVGSGNQKHANEMLVDALKHDPELGKKLGSKAMHFRYKAQIENAEMLQKKYAKVLQEAQHLISEGKIAISARTIVAMNRMWQQLGSWIKDNPVLGGGACAALLILTKIAIAILVIDELRGSSKKKKRNQAALHTSPAQLSSAGRAWPPQANQMQYASAPIQAILPTAPTPLQMALNMPLGS